MKRGVPYGPITLYLLLVVGLVVLSCLLCNDGHYSWLMLTVPVAVWSTFKLYGIYSELIERLRFILNAVQNNDYSFRFAENPRYSRHAAINHFLNRIKEVLDKTKLEIREKERYFELIMEYANIGIITATPTGVVMQTNSKAMQMLGLPRLSHFDQLRPLGEELWMGVKSVAPSEQRVVKVTNEFGEASLMVSCAEMQFNERTVRVYSLGNIHEELDRKEIESWEKLTRILTHEIMNSLAPVTSISHTLLLEDKSEEDMRRGLESIHATSGRLLDFVGAFREVTRIPLPQKSPFSLLGLVEEVVELIPHEGVRVEIRVEPEDTMLYADRAQISQVLVNLMKNAVEALAETEGERQITISSTIEKDESIRVELTNNGPAIPPELTENIFTPFFTSKSEGSGIGLAVSRQIVRLHGGSLRLKHNATGAVTFSMHIE